MKPIHPLAWRGRQVQPLTTNDLGDYTKQMLRLTALQIERNDRLIDEWKRRTAALKKRDADGDEVAA